MNLSKLKDQEVLSQIKLLVQNERAVLTSILHHLREVESRKLFSELKYSSLFEYAVKELKYSEPQAGRRISAMRLLKELPQVEEKIQSGTLNLSNLCQAQTYFRSADKKAKAEKVPSLSSGEKIEILERLENKSVREGEKLLISLLPEVELPKEKERVLSESHAEVRFIMDEELRMNLEKVRSLLGLKGLGMTFAELAKEMSVLSIQILSQKAFGKKRVEIARTVPSQSSEKLPSTSKVESDEVPFAAGKPNPSLSFDKANNTDSLPTSKVTEANANYISRDLKFKIWQRDRGCCTLCGSRKNLNYDHIHPKALGGNNSFENLRLLCFHCNQRRALKTFGPSPTSSLMR